MSASRRTFLHRSAVVGAAVMTGSMPRFAQADSAVEFGSRLTFDKLDAVVGIDPALVKGNETGSIGWGGSYMLQSYLLMHQANGETRFLDKFVERFDRMLLVRDSVRGVSDYRGKSQPTWRTMGKYTCGAVKLKNDAGEETLLVRSGARPASQLSVIVSAGTRPGTFKLTATKADAKTPEVDAYDNLTMDRSSPDYAVTRINGEFEKVNGGDDGSRTMITVSDLRAEGATGSTGASLPAFLGPAKLISQPYVYAVQVGMVLYPVAVFVRWVHEAAVLHAKYTAKALEYLAAIEEAVAGFDYEWQENEKGEGWLNWAKGSPIPFDGCDQAHNQYLALGRVLIELSAVVKGERGKVYRDRATKMARTFKNDLKLGPNGAYSRTYFWTKGKAFDGWDVKDDVSVYQPSWVYNKTRGHKAIEDSSHGHIDALFALSAYENGIVFDETDMKRFTATLTKNILVRDGEDVTTKEGVDGGGGKGFYRHMAGTWAPFARFDSMVVELLRTLYRKPIEGSASLPAVMYACANMNCAGK